MQKFKIIQIQTLQSVEIPTEGSLFVGREGDMAFPSDQKMSRRHAEVIWRNGQVYLIDLNSTNGSFVNGKRVEQDREVELRLNDLIHIGAQEFKLGLCDHTNSFEVEDDTPPPAFHIQTDDGAIAQKFHHAEEDLQSYRSAPLWRRFVASLIDGIVINVVSQIAMVVSSRIFGTQSVELSLLVSLLNILVGYAAGYFYIIKPIHQSGQNFSKKLMEIKVINCETGNFLSVSDLILREWIYKFITIILFFISLPMYFFNEDKRFMHDLFAGSKVVHTGNE